MLALPSTLRNPCIQHPGCYSNGVAIFSIANWLPSAGITVGPGDVRFENKMTYWQPPGTQRILKYSRGAASNV